MALDWITMISSCSNFFCTVSVPQIVVIYNLLDPLVQSDPPNQMHPCATF